VDDRFARTVVRQARDDLPDRHDLPPVTEHVRDHAVGVGDECRVAALVLDLPRVRASRGEIGLRDVAAGRCQLERALRLGALASL
jgi:hypothetical protein